MTITQAMTAAEGLTGQVFPQEALLRWLSELDGQLAFEVYGVDSWTAYSEEDLGSLLLVPYPWDGLYVHKLEAMTYFSNGEYDRYANAQRMYEEALGEFKRFVQRTRQRRRPTGRTLHPISIMSGRNQHDHNTHCPR